MANVFISVAKRCYWRLRDCEILCADDLSGTLKDYRVDTMLDIDTRFDNAQVAQGVYKDAPPTNPRATRCSSLCSITCNLAAMMCSSIRAAGKAR